MKVAPESILFLGDSNTDMQTAVTAGMVPLGAAWGFRGRDELLASGAASVLNTPLELMDWLRP
jgi:phosphoglycolate phosphatase